MAPTPRWTAWPSSSSERTGGNPFFVEEVVQSLVEDGRLVGERGACRLVGPVADAAVPASVQATLAARIDRLEPRAKAVLQGAAVIGREFDVAVLERIAGLEPEELEGALGRLVAGELVQERAPRPEGRFAFKHPLTQEVAYRSQLGGRRAALHAAAARAVAEVEPGRLDERAGLIAGHWEAAGEDLEAARWHARAAVWAGTTAPAQALAHWRRVRELADGLPEGPESVALALTARMLALQYSWRMGLAHDEAQAAFEEAHRLAVRSGDVRSQAILLNGFGAALGVGDGDLREFARLQRAAIALAESAEDPALYLSIAPGSYALMCTGAYREAVAMCDRAIELSGGDATLGGGVNYACPYAWCHGFKGMVLVGLGELDEARDLIERCRRIAREQGDLEVVGFSHLYSTYRSYVAGEPEDALRHAHQGVEIAERIGDAFSRVFGWFCVGLAEQMRGEWQRAIDAVERSVAIARESRIALDPDVLLSEAHLALGDVVRARELATKGLEVARAQGNVLNETLNLLALARVLLGSGEDDLLGEAGAVLAEALRLARDTGARGFEPLAHVELGELARRRGDDALCERELREAHRGFVAAGAHGRARDASVALAGAGR